MDGQTESGASKVAIGPRQPWTNPFPLQLKGWFRHKSGDKLLYVSHLLGHLNLAVQEDEGDALQCQFRTGIGKQPKGLSILFWSASRERPGAIGSFPCIMTAPWVKEEDLEQWLGLRSEQSPALTFTLSPLKPADEVAEFSASAGLYTNQKTISGNFFVMDSSETEPHYRYYCKVAVPPLRLRLSLEPGKLEQGDARLEAATVLLSEISPSLWKDILSRGDGRPSFPETPLPAEGVSLARLHEGSPTLPEQLSSIVSSIESMRTASVLSTEDASLLLEELDVDSKPGSKARTEDHIYSLLRYERTVHRLSDLITPSASQCLLALAHDAQGNLVRAPEYTPSEPGERVDWHVAADADSAAPDGSANSPFPSIAAALEAAQSGSVPGLNLQVQGGIYREPLVITRDTEITATPGHVAVISGSIGNRTPARLKLNGVYLIGAEGGPAVGIWNDEATTILTNVTIVGADSNGVHHHGGNLWLAHVAITDTQSVEGEVYWSGAGIVVTGGCTAVLNDVVTSENESNGIVADGAGTYLWGSDIEIAGNRLNPFFAADYLVPTGPLRAGPAALTLQYGALATLSRVSIRNNEGQGFLIGEGSRAEATGLIVADTYASTLSEDSSASGTAAGFGIILEGNSYAEITTILVTHNAFCGIVISEDSAIDLHDGEVSYSYWGAYIFSPDFDVARLLDCVDFHHNEEGNLGYAFMPIPWLPTSIEEAMEGPPDE